MYTVFTVRKFARNLQIGRPVHSFNYFGSELGNVWSILLNMATKLRVP